MEVNFLEYHFLDFHLNAHEREVLWSPSNEPKRKGIPILVFQICSYPSSFFTLSQKCIIYRIL